MNILIKAIIVTSVLAITIVVTDGFNGFIKEETQIQILMFFFIMQILFLTLYSVTKKLHKNISKNGVVIQRAMLKEKYLKAQEDTFPSFIKPTNPMNITMFNINFTVEDSNIEFGFIKKIFDKILPVEIDRITNIEMITTPDEKKVTVTANIVLGPKEELNFRFNKDIFINSFSVEEYYNV